SGDRCARSIWLWVSAELVVSWSPVASSRISAEVVRGLAVYCSRRRDQRYDSCAVCMDRGQSMRFLHELGDPDRPRFSLCLLRVGARADSRLTPAAADGTLAGPYFGAGALARPFDNFLTGRGPVG